MFQTNTGNTFIKSLVGFNLRAQVDSNDRLVRVVWVCVPVPYTEVRRSDATCCSPRICKEGVP